MKGLRRLACSGLLAVIAVSWSTTVQAQEKQAHQFIVLIKRGPKWIAGKGVSEQPLLKHGKYLKELMDKGFLQFAGPFVDDSGGFILLNAADEAEARRITGQDPGVLDEILAAEIHEIRIAFDAATGKSPFN